MATSTIKKPAKIKNPGSLAPTIQGQVFAILKSEGPMSDEQVQFRLGIKGSTARTRRKELQDAGLVVQKGESFTSSGRKCALWGIGR